MPSHLARLATTDGAALLVHPHRVTLLAPAVALVGPGGVAERTVVHVSVPHLLRVGETLGQAWDTVQFLVLGSPRDVEATLWPDATARPKEAT